MNLTHSKESANIWYSNEIINVHHQLRGSAEAIQTYHSLHLGGMIGITFNLSPCLPMDANNAADVKAVSF